MEQLRAQATSVLDPCRIAGFPHLHGTHQGWVFEVGHHFDLACHPAHGNHRRYTRRVAIEAIEQDVGSVDRADDVQRPEATFDGNVLVVKDRVTGEDARCNIETGGTVISRNTIRFWLPKA